MTIFIKQYALGLKNVAIILGSECEDWGQSIPIKKIEIMWRFISKKISYEPLCILYHQMFWFQNLLVKRHSSKWQYIFFQKLGFSIIWYYLSADFGLQHPNHPSLKRKVNWHWTPKSISSTGNQQINTDCNSGYDHIHLSEKKSPITLIYDFFIKQVPVVMTHGVSLI